MSAVNQYILSSVLNRSKEFSYLIALLAQLLNGATNYLGTHSDIWEFLTQIAMLVVKFDILQGALVNQSRIGRNNYLLPLARK